MDKHLELYMKHCEQTSSTPVFSLDGTYPTRKDATVCLLDIIVRIEGEGPKVVHTQFFSRYKSCADLLKA